ncbi:hypothetical protein [Pyxidicoccus sp. MSG2]|uniref:hypothetical protein n=1 Tax=Pyxidicoccus sp. MSG2 TaxID=2996790 RepID=UPI002271A6AC|nr:hypothetical protein [Pyxidicoccus sp. MSG2]MCY1019193.1 hypothetical protein [Pyxidicoccus sp. MSG2]
MRQLVLLLCLATACASPSRTSRPGAGQPGTQAGNSTTGGSTAPGEPEPTGAFARELPPLPKHRVDSPERVFTAEVEASAPPTLARNEGSTRIDIPLGTGAALACFVYERPLDAAGALLAVAKAVSEGPGVTVRRMQPTEVAVVEGAPALFFRVDYETTAPGQMKLMVSTSRELPLLCAHDEPGYARTFRRITLDLARTLQAPGHPRASEQGEELHVLKLDGQLAGFEWRTSRSEAPGRTRTESTTSLLLPGADGTQRAEDITTTTLTDERGHLTELRHARAEDGALTMQVTLRREKEPATRPPSGGAPAAPGAPTAQHEAATRSARGDPAAPGAPTAQREAATRNARGAEPAGPEALTVPGTTYRYEGRQGARVLKGNFTSNRGLATDDDVRLAVSRWLLPGDRPEVVLDVYRPADDVTAPLELTLRRDSSASALTLTVGASTARARANARGQLEWLEQVRPEGKLTSELIHTSP